MKNIIVSGALANKPGNGGGVWERMSWAMGLKRLGFNVYFVEQIAPATCVDSAGATTSLAESVNLAWFRAMASRFGMTDRAALVPLGKEDPVGMTWAQLQAVAESAELLVNLSGHLTIGSLLERIRRKAYVDVDPGYTQFWHADPASKFRLAGHDHYFTIGENIGDASCSIPTGGIRWRPVRQPVILDDWEVTPSLRPDRFTTIASWRGAYGTIEYAGRRYGLKAHEFRRFIDLPRTVWESSEWNPEFEIALEIHPGDSRDLIALRERGWRVVEPRVVVGDADAFRRYVQDSSAEFSVAQGIYVETNSGWFSERTARYLASGKPALVQDTGFTRHYPTGEGLLAFRTLDEAAQGAAAIAKDPDRHSRAARRLAEEYFDSDKVLSRFLDKIGIGP